MAPKDLRPRVPDSEVSKALLDAARLLELVAQGEEDIREGRVMAQEEVFSRVHSRMKKVRIERK